MSTSFSCGANPDRLGYNVHPPRYFAYGSNMNPARVAERGLAVVAVESAKLHGYCLRFDKVSRQHPTESHANVVWDRDGVVEGVLYTLASHAEIEKMDRFEATPVNYGREAVEVSTDSGVVSAWTYFANPAVRVEGLLPSDAYLSHLLAGASYLSADYLAFVRRQAGRAH